MRDEFSIASFDLHEPRTCLSLIVTIATRSLPSLRVCCWSSIRAYDLVKKQSEASSRSLFFAINHAQICYTFEQHVFCSNDWLAAAVRRYVAHSNNIQKVGEVPTVRLTYDILPIVVVMAEKRQAFYHFITNVSTGVLLVRARKCPSWL